MSRHNTPSPARVLTPSRTTAWPAQVIMGRMTAFVVAYEVMITIALGSTRVGMSSTALFASPHFC
jgi:hypothetical protein